MQRRPAFCPVWPQALAARPGSARTAALLQERRSAGAPERAPRSVRARRARRATRPSAGSPGRPTRTLRTKVQTTNVRHHYTLQSASPALQALDVIHTDYSSINYNCNGNVGSSLFRVGTDDAETVRLRGCEATTPTLSRSWEIVWPPCRNVLKLAAFLGKSRTDVILFRSALTPGRRQRNPQLNRSSLSSLVPPFPLHPLRTARSRMFVRVAWASGEMKLPTQI